MGTNPYTKTENNGDDNSDAVRVLRQDKSDGQLEVPSRSRTSSQTTSFYCGKGTTDTVYARLLPPTWNHHGVDDDDDDNDGSVSTALASPQALALLGFVARRGKAGN